MENRRKKTEKEREIRLLLTPKQNLRRCCIPLTFNADIYDDGGSFRIWSTIVLGHLLHQVSESVAATTGRLIRRAYTLPQTLPQSQFKPTFKQLHKRGRYLTRRPGKYWWMSSSCDENVANTAEYHCPTLLDQVTLASRLTQQIDYQHHLA